MEMPGYLLSRKLLRKLLMAALQRNEKLPAGSYRDWMYSRPVFILNMVLLEWRMLNNIQVNKEE